MSQFIFKKELEHIPSKNGNNCGVHFSGRIKCIHHAKKILAKKSHKFNSNVPQQNRTKFWESLSFCEFFYGLLPGKWGFRQECG